MSSTFPLEELPPDLRKLVVSHMYAACKRMTVSELCVLRLVNVRMAQAFYKRCMMLTMHGRYHDFFFPIRHTQGVPHSPPFRFHAMFPDPATMPRYEVDLRQANSFIYVDLAFYAKVNRSISTLMLMQQGRDSCRDFGPMPQHEIDGHMADHKLEICKNLYPQEVRLFGLRERPLRRPKAMDRIKIELGYKKSRFPWH